MISVQCAVAAVVVVVVAACCLYNSLKQNSNRKHSFVLQALDSWKCSTDASLLSLLSLLYSHVYVRKFQVFGLLGLLGSLLLLRGTLRTQPV